MKIVYEEQVEEAYADGVKDRRENLPRKNASDYWGQYAQHYTQGYADARKENENGDS